MKFFIFAYEMSVVGKQCWENLSVGKLMIRNFEVGNANSMLKGFIDVRKSKMRIQISWRPCDELEKWVEKNR